MLKRRNYYLKEQELEYWLAWNSILDIGPKRFYMLIDRYGSAEEAWMESPEIISKFLKLNHRISQRFITQKKKIVPKKQLELIDKKQAKVVTIEDSLYPGNLRNIHLPPPLLYYKGTLFDSDKSAISIVGSRKATYYGKMVAETFSKNLSLAGLSIISGLARGVDAIAHKSALSVNGRTLAVLGCGIDIIYPPENRKLAAEIEESGAVLTEFPLSTLPERQNFPRRNRIISGLSLGTLVVEAAEKSGALITADFALEQGREVFAIPGNINSSLSKGTHNLIKQGAKLAHNYKDVLEELLFEMPCKPKEKKENRQLDNLSEDDLLIYHLLSCQKPMQIDEITVKSKLSPNKVNTIMLNLELKDLIKELEGKNYIRIY